MSKATGIVLDVAGQRGGPMPGVATLYDRSRWKNHGTFGAGAAQPTWVQTRTGLWVLSFDGGDTIEIPHSGSLDINDTNFSLEAWLIPSDGLVEHAIIGKGGTAGWTHKWGITYGAVAIRFRFFLETAGGATTLDTLNDYAAASWWHVFCTHDGTMRLYVNGVLDNSKVWGGSVLSVAESLWFGHLNFPGVARYVGWMWQPRVFRYTLSAAQVRARFQATRGLFGV